MRTLRVTLAAIAMLGGGGHDHASVDVPKDDVSGVESKTSC